MSEKAHARRAAAELVLTAVAIAVIAASAWFVLRDSLSASDVLEERRALLAEFEELRVAIDLAFDLDDEAQSRELTRIRGQIELLEPRWRDCPPVRGSLPVLVYRHGRQLLVLEVDGHRASGPVAERDAAPR